MKAIGGYFELELSKGEQSYHTTPYKFKSGRSSLHYILDVVRPSLVYIPFYTCNALMVPFEALGIPYQFYRINAAMEPEELPVLNGSELFLYVNYFDIKRSVVRKLSDLYGKRLVVDCSQAFFMKGNGNSWFFNSCRKFFGVPDGSFLYAPEGINLSQPPEKNKEYFFEHLLGRFNGDPGAGYPTFVKNEIACGPEWKGMSRLSDYLLSHVNYNDVIERRRYNFFYMLEATGRWNQMNVELDPESVPMCYPYLPGKAINVEIFFSDSIYIPRFWIDVLNRSNTGYEVEIELASKLVPFPVDHRYTIEDLKRIIKILKYQP